MGLALMPVSFLQYQDPSMGACLKLGGSGKLS